MSETYREAIRWWLHYLRLLTGKPPWPLPGKITIEVSVHTGEEIARLLELTPNEVNGRACLQVDKLIAIEWIKPGTHGTWGSGSTNDPDPRERYFRNAEGALELKKKW